MCETTPQGVTVMLDASENILCDNVFFDIQIKTGGDKVTLTVAEATGGGVYRYNGDGIEKLAFETSKITLTRPPSAEEMTVAETTNDAPEENAPMPHSGTYYVGYQRGVDDRGAVRFLILSERNADAGAVWWSRGHGDRLSLTVERRETVDFWQDGQRRTVSAILPDGRAGVWYVYTFRGLNGDAPYEFCVEDGEGIQKINVKTPRFTS